MKLTGLLLTIAGAISAVIGYIKLDSWEYKVANAFGASMSPVPTIALYGGIAALIIGIILLIVGFKMD